MNEVRPTFSRRIVARLIDVGLLIMFSLLVSSLVRDTEASLDAHVGIGNPQVDLIILLVAGFYLTMVGVGALYGGRTPGRLITGLSIAGVDSARISAQQIVGRDLLRTTSFLLALALLEPATTRVSDTVKYLGATNTYLVMAINVGLPVVAAAALITAIAAADPRGRGLHDRVAGSVVVRR